jgi:hypothetical protein
MPMTQPYAQSRLKRSHDHLSELTQLLVSAGAHREGQDGKQPSSNDS